jgi:hypothetical protein
MMKKFPSKNPVPPCSLNNMCQHCETKTVAERQDTMHMGLVQPRFSPLASYSQPTRWADRQAERKERLARAFVFYIYNLPSSSMVLMRFLMNSKDEKKMALTTQDRLMETPRPRYMWRLKNSILGAGSTASPLDRNRAFRW